MKTKEFTPAIDREYRSITTDIKTKEEADIIASIEHAMRGVDAIWVPTSTTTVQCYRKKSHLKTLNHEKR
jgi:hypothetical protein